MTGRWDTLAAQDLVAATVYNFTVPGGYNEFYVQWRGTYNGDASGNFGYLRLNNDATADYASQDHIHGVAGHSVANVTNNTGIPIVQGTGSGALSIGSLRLVQVGTHWLIHMANSQVAGDNTFGFMRHTTMRKALAVALSTLYFNFRIAGSVSNFTGRINIYGGE